jgi:hypothetical protein
MKSRILLVLAGFLIVSMLAISPASAHEVVYTANGKLDEYVVVMAAEVYRGHWRIRIEDDKVIFRGWYLELNVDEEIPGTLDFFRLDLIDASEPIIDDGECIVEGTLVFRKIGWDNPFGPTMPGYKDLPGARYTAKFTFCAIITINPDGILIEFPAPEQGIAGSTSCIQY